LAFRSLSSDRVNLNELKKNQKALCIVWQYACNSHVCVVVPSKFAKGKKGQAGRVNFFNHCIAATHCREGWIFPIPMRFDSALTTEERVDKWLTKYSEDLAAYGQLIDRDVEYEMP
jgi:hypothetical protein